MWIPDGFRVVGNEFFTDERMAVCLTCGAAIPVNGFGFDNPWEWVYLHRGWHTPRGSEKQATP